MKLISNFDECMAQYTAESLEQTNKEITEAISTLHRFGLTVTFK